MVIDQHPLIATGSAVRAGVNRVADVLSASGAQVQRHSSLLPDLAESAVLHTRLLISEAGARLPLAAYEQLKPSVAALSADDRSLDAMRLRAKVCSHREWIEANDRRELHRDQWRAFFAEFDIVVCPVTSTPAFPHDTNPNRDDRRIDIDGIGYPYNDQFVWVGLATMPGLPATVVPAGRSPGSRA